MKEGLASSLASLACIRLDFNGEEEILRSSRVPDGLIRAESEHVN